MPAGTVSVDDNGVVTGSGDAKTLYDTIEAAEIAVSPLPNPAVKPPDFEGTALAWLQAVKPLMVRIKRAWARQALAIATVLHRDRKLRAVNATGPITSADEFVSVTARAGAIVLTIDAGIPVGKELVVVDASGEGVAKPITVAGGGGELIDGAANIIIGAAYGGIHLTKTVSGGWVASSKQ